MTWIKNVLLKSCLIVVRATTWRNFQSSDQMLMWNVLVQYIYDQVKYEIPWEYLCWTTCCTKNLYKIYLDIFPVILLLDQRRLWKKTSSGYIIKQKSKVTLREKCPNTELFLVRIFLYSDWIQSALRIQSEYRRVSLRIQSEYRKIRTRNNSVVDTFHGNFIFKVS